MEQAPVTTETAAPKGRKTGTIVAAVVIIVIIVVAGLYFYLNMPSTGTTKAVSIFENPVGTCGTATECGYNPSPLDVTKGTKVEWTNNGNQPHSVTACDSRNSPASAGCPTMNVSGLDNFDSGSASYLSAGQKFSTTFNTVGAYYYYCRVHTYMQGQVNVTS